MPRLPHAPAGDEDPGLAAALLALDPLDEALQATLFELLVTQEAWHDLARLAHLSNLTPALDARLGALTPVPVRIAWLTRPGRAFGDACAVLADERRPAVLVRLLDPGISTRELAGWLAGEPGTDGVGPVGGLPSPELLAYVTHLAAELLPAQVLRCPTAGPAAWAVAGAALARQLDRPRRRVSARLDRDPVHWLKACPQARPAFDAAVSGLDSVAIAIRLPGVTPRDADRFVAILLAALAALAAQLAADPSAFYDDAAIATRDLLSGSLSVLYTRPWCTPAHVAAVRAALAPLAALMAAGEHGSTKPYQPDAAVLWEHLAIMPPVLGEYLARLEAIMARIPHLVTAEEFDALRGELLVLEDQLEDATLDEMHLDFDELLSSYTRPAFELLLAHPQASAHSRLDCARRVVRHRVGASTELVEAARALTGGQPEALAALAYAAADSVPEDAGHWLACLRPVLACDTAETRRRFALEYLEHLRHDRAARRLPALAALCADEEGFTLALEVLSVSELCRSMRAREMPATVRTRYARALEQALAGQPPVFWHCFEQFAPGFEGTLTELVSTCRATLA